MSEQTPTDPVAVPIPPTPAAPAVSPTGAPLLPPKLVPYALYVATVAVAVTMAPDLGITLPAAVLGAAKFLTLLATLFGLASPGVRK